MPLLPSRPKIWSSVLLPARYSSIVPPVAGMPSDETTDALLRSQSTTTIRLTGFDRAIRPASEQAKVDFPSPGRDDVIRITLGGLSNEPSAIAVKADLSASA